MPTSELVLHRGLFELFTQAERSADRSQGGLGIGLSLVGSIIQFHGGRLTTASKGTGTGAKFAVLLPRHIELQTAASPGGEEPVSPPVRTFRIMIVDDNKDATHMLPMLLDAAGHER